MEDTEEVDCPECDGDRYHIVEEKRRAKGGGHVVIEHTQTCACCQGRGWVLRSEFETYFAPKPEPAPFDFRAWYEQDIANGGDGVPF